jgi:oxygen-independent coproporphyrinogen III oxidase
MTQPIKVSGLQSERNGLGDWGWEAIGAQPNAAYVHIPFCRHRCGYCNFSLMANRDDLFERFLNALEIELSELKIPRPVETLFLGGGTPSILPRGPMERMLSLLRVWLPMHPHGEWSMEANPLDITDSFCRHVKSLGVNRLSIGGQSFHSAKLKRLERDHSPEQLKESVWIAMEHFDSVSLDLIFAAPDETLEGWHSDLNQATQLGVQHVSTYGLTFEKGARFWGMRQRHEIDSVPEDLELELYKSAIDFLCQHGFEHYEISNFAKPGNSCRHNQNYWLGKPWWAFGPSAARYVGGNRSVNHRGTLEYIRRIENHHSAVDEFERLTPEQMVRERFVFGMRQLAGVNWGALKSETELAVGQSMEIAIEKHVAAGWMIRDGDQIRLSREGLFISDALWSEYL